MFRSFFIAALQQKIKEFAEAVGSSYGPKGLKKLYIKKETSTVFLTSNSQKMLHEMSKKNPLLIIIERAVQTQAKEVGDGGNFTALLICEFLKAGAKLIDKGVHKSTVMRGFECATKQLLTRILPSLASFELKDFNDADELAKFLRAPVASKMLGAEQKLASLVAQAAIECRQQHPEKRLLVERIQVIKDHGVPLEESKMVKGIVTLYKPSGKVESVQNAKVAVFSCSIEAAAAELKGTVLIENAEELITYSRGEEQHLRDIFEHYHKLGVKVVISNSAIGKLAEHYCNEFGMLASVCSNKFEFRRVAEVCNAPILVRFNKSAGLEDLGFCEHIYYDKQGLTYLLIMERAASPVTTILARHTTKTQLGEMGSAIDNTINTAKLLLKNNKCLAGAGAVETQIAAKLEEFADQSEDLDSLDKTVVKAFGNAFLEIFKVLADNAGFDGFVLARKLVQHYKGKGPHEQLGLNVETGGFDSVEKLVCFDALLCKQNAIRLASEAAVTLLRVDSVLQKEINDTLNIGAPPGHWDDRA